APNVKTVVAADEFGAASEGDVGEFLKFLPGVSMDTLAGDARQVSLGGVDFNYTPVTFGGFGMTNGNQGGTNRGVSLEYMSLNKGPMQCFLSFLCQVAPQGRGILVGQYGQ